jgi:hypothetical protein
VNKVTFFNEPDMTVKKVKTGPMNSQDFFGSLAGI